MKKRYVAVWMVVVTFLLTAPMSAVAGGKKMEDLEIYYGRLVDGAIKNCEAKNKMRNSWSESVRRTAAVAYLKGTYFKAYKAELVQSMIDEKIGEKPYQVNYYLNKRFYRIFSKEPEYIVRR
jgi:hypothetical protein